MMDWYTRTRVTGREHFRTLKHPVVLVANHSSHLDTPMILRALPRRFRQRTAVAAAADYFYRSRLRAAFVALVFNTVPIARGGGGLGKGANGHIDQLLSQRWNLLLYPEGTRSRSGEVGKLRRGAAVLAAHHGLSVVPIFVKGTHEAMPPGQIWPRRRLFARRHPVEIHFGEPIPTSAAETGRVTEQIRAFLEQEAAATEALTVAQGADEPDRLAGVG